MANVFLLTGKPGTGKTTIVKEILTRFSLKSGGFYTEEIRESGTRTGFKLVTLNGNQVILAHQDFATPYRVSKYGVDIGALKNIGVSAIQQAINDCDLIVIDEIGKMELFSIGFREVVLQALSSGKKILGTIMLKPNLFADKIKKHPAVNLFTVTPENRKYIRDELVHTLG